MLTLLLCGCSQLVVGPDSAGCVGVMPMQSSGSVQQEEGKTAPFSSKMGLEGYNLLLNLPSSGVLCKT